MSAMDYPDTAPSFAKSKTDRPIMFSAPMVRALLAGRKTQTRRIIGDKVPPPPDPVDLAWPAKKPWPYLDAYCSGKRTPENPRGMGENWAWWTRDDRPCEQFRVGYVPGDRLWVRETWAEDEQFGGVLYRADHSGDDPIGNGWRPSIFMPRAKSRITLTVTDVRVQRLQEISEDDAKAEGCGPIIPDDVKDHPLAKHIGPPAINAFAAVWERLHGETGPKSWESNPWVVAISFAVEKRNIDAECAEQRQGVAAA